MCVCVCELTLAISRNSLPPAPLPPEEQCVKVKDANWPPGKGTSCGKWGAQRRRSLAALGTPFTLAQPSSRHSRLQLPQYTRCFPYASTPLSSLFPTGHSCRVVTHLDTEQKFGKSAKAGAIRHLRFIVLSSQPKTD